MASVRGKQNHAISVEGRFICNEITPCEKTPRFSLVWAEINIQIAKSWRSEFGVTAKRHGNLADVDARGYTQHFNIKTHSYMCAAVMAWGKRSSDTRWVWGNLSTPLVLTDLSSNMGFRKRKLQNIRFHITMQRRFCVWLNLVLTFCSQIWIASQGHLGEMRVFHLNHCLWSVKGHVPPF